MDFESLLNELRSDYLSSFSPEDLAKELAATLANGDDESAERAALAAYYASILSKPVEVPGFKELLAEPATESREHLRGRLWWVRLNQAALLSDDDPTPIVELAESILAQERSPYARDRVFTFLKSWPLLAAIFPFLGSRPLSAIEIPDDRNAVNLVKDKAKLAAQQAITMSYTVARSAKRSVTSWAMGELELYDAIAAVEIAEPLLEDFPWGELKPATLAAQALNDVTARPRLRGAVQLYGAWIWARFGESAMRVRPEGAHVVHTLPASWSVLLENLAEYRKIDTWCDSALLKLEAMLSMSPSLAATDSSILPTPRSPEALRLAFIEALAQPAPARYNGLACEQSVTMMLKGALVYMTSKGGQPLSKQEAEAFTAVLRSRSPFRVEAAATVLRVISKTNVDISPVIPAMAEALLASPADSGGLSPGTDLGPRDLKQYPGCDWPKAFDDIDIPPSKAEDSFMNLNKLSILLFMCMPAITAHRLAKALIAALGSNALDEETRKLVNKTLHQAAKKGNVAAKAYLQKKGTSQPKLI